MTQLPPPSFTAMFDKYHNWWSSLTVTKTTETKLAAQKILAGKARYQTVERLTAVPWYVIGLLHMRESGNNFSRWLHNGDPMFDRTGTPLQTVQVPTGRPPNPSVSWEVGAVDALQEFKLTTIKDWSAERIAYVAESFNGWGYTLYRHIPSPYLYGGSSIQQRGKYTSDGKYDPDTMDTQLGVLTTLKALMALDPTITLLPGVTIKPATVPVPVPTSTPAKPQYSLLQAIVSFIAGLFKKK